MNSIHFVFYIMNKYIFKWSCFHFFKKHAYSYLNNILRQIEYSSCSQEAHNRKTDGMPIE